MLYVQQRVGSDSLAADWTLKLKHSVIWLEFCAPIGPESEFWGLESFLKLSRTYLGTSTLFFSFEVLNILIIIIFIYITFLHSNTPLPPCHKSDNYLRHSSPHTVFILRLVTENNSYFHILFDINYRPPPNHHICVIQCS